MNGHKWTAAEADTLLRLERTHALGYVADKLGRSEAAIKAKLAKLRGKTYGRTVPSGSQTSPQAPTPRPNDCRKHLSRILVAHRGGFPVCGAPR